MAVLETWALCSVDDVKELLGIDASEHSKDNLIIRKINQASSVIEGYCGFDQTHHFISTSYTNEEYYGTGTRTLILRGRPVTAISSLQERGTTLNVSDWDSLDTENFFFSGGSGVVDSSFGFARHPHQYRISYTAGYATIPHDLAEAAATFAAYLVENPTSSGSGVKAKTQGPKKIEYYESSPSSSLFEQLDIDDVLARYSTPPILYE